MADGSVGFQSVDGRPSSSHFIFDQETDDPYSYLLFEFTIAGTWEKRWLSSTHIPRSRRTKPMSQFVSRPPSTDGLAHARGTKLLLFSTDSERAILEELSNLHEDIKVDPS